MKIKLYFFLMLLGSFFLVSCGGNDCTTCSLEGNDTEEICEDDFTAVPGISTADQLRAWREGFESLGYDCN